MPFFSDAWYFTFDISDAWYMIDTFATYWKKCLCCCDILLQGKVWNQRLASVLKEWQCHPITCPDRTNKSRDKHSSVSQTEVSVTLGKKDKKATYQKPACATHPPSLTAMSSSYFSLVIFLPFPMYLLLLPWPFPRHLTKSLVPGTDINNISKSL